jgi:hypothetical protein
MNLLKIIGTVAIKLPAAVVKDVITMGDALIDDEPQTVKTMREINEDIFEGEER